MKRLLYFIFCLAIYANGHSQSFTMCKSFGGNHDDFTTKIHTDNLGNHFVVGFFASTSLTIGSTTLVNHGDTNVFIAKFDANWSPIWAHSGEGTGIDYGLACTTDNEGNSYFVGCYYSSSIKFGNTILYNANPVVTSDLFIVKYDSDGNVVWAKKNGALGTDKACGAIFDQNTHHINITGWFYSDKIVFGTDTLTNKSSGFSEIFLTQMDNNGNFLWAKSAKGTQSDEPTAITMDHNSNIYISGWFSSDTLSFSNNLKLFNKGGYYPRKDVFVAKYNLSGNIVWAKSAGGSNSDVALDVSVDSLGNHVFVVGSFNSDFLFFGTTHLANSGGEDAFIACYSNNGDFIWARKSNGSSDDRASSVAIDYGGYIYVAGGFKSYSLIFGSDTLINKSKIDNDGLRMSDIFILKYNFDGNISWATRAGGRGEDAVSSIEFEAKNVCNMIGLFTDTAYFGSVPLVSKGSTDLFIAKTGLCNGVSGYFYNDLNFNHVRDMNEPGIRDYLHISPGNEVVLSDNSGYFRTFVNEGTSVLKPDSILVYNIFPRQRSVDFTGCGDSLTNLNFAFVDSLNVISGKIFNDSNKNGIQDPGELPLKYFNLSVVNSFTGATKSLTTDTLGIYIVGVDTGCYNVIPYHDSLNIITPVSYQLCFSTYNNKYFDKDFAIVDKANIISGKITNNSPCFITDTSYLYKTITIEFLNTTYNYKTYCLTKLDGSYANRVGIGNWKITPQISSTDTLEPLFRNCTFNSYFNTSSSNDFAIKGIPCSLNIDIVSGIPNHGWWDEDGVYHVNGDFFPGILYHITCTNVNFGSVIPRISYVYNNENITTFDGLYRNDIPPTNPFPDWPYPIFWSTTSRPDSLIWTTQQIENNSVLNINVHNHSSRPLDSTNVKCVAKIYYNDVLQNFAVDNRLLIGEGYCWDPNDIQVFPGGNFTLKQVEKRDSLVYLIRFQNTGTAMCHNARILDTLNKNLDISSFELLSTSHKSVVNLLGNGILEVIFDKINLPDSSSNFEESQGYVKYRIRPRTSLVIGDSINNYAHVYFDFNQPVATNTVVTKIQEDLSVPQIKKNEDLLKIYPNPFTSSTKIRMPSGDKAPLSLSIFDQTGREVDFISGITSPEIEYQNQSLSNGLYFVIVKNALGKTIGKAKMLVM